MLLVIRLFCYFIIFVLFYFIWMTDKVLLRFVEVQMQRKRIDAVSLFYDRLNTGHLVLDGYKMQILCLGCWLFIVFYHIFVREYLTVTPWNDERSARKVTFSGIPLAKEMIKPIFSHFDWYPAYNHLWVQSTVHHLNHWSIFIFVYSFHVLTWSQIFIDKDMNAKKYMCHFIAYYKWLISRGVYILIRRICIEYIL